MAFRHTIELSKAPSVMDVLDSKFCSLKLKAAVEQFTSMDPVDAFRDAEILVAVMKRRLSDCGIAEVR